MFKEIYETNQTIKRYGDYTWDANRELFIAHSSPFQVVYVPRCLDTLLLHDLFSSSFTLNGNEVFELLKGEKTKTLTYEGNSLVNASGNTLLVKNDVPSITQQEFSILKVLEEEDHDYDIFLDQTSPLYYQGVKEFDSVTATNIYDLVRSASKLCDHTLIYIQISEDKVNIVPSQIELDITKPFIILDNNIFQKLKALKKDTPYLNIMIKDNFNSLVINYGIEDVEHLFFKCSGLFKL